MASRTRLRLIRIRKRRNKEIATKYFTLKGSVKWAKIYEPDEFSGVKRWMLNFYPADGAEWEKFQKMGTELQTKDDEDGKYVVFRRPVNKVIGDNFVMFSPPEISGAVEVKYVNDEGVSVRSYNKGDKVTVTRIGDPVPIGNGSVVLVNLAVYDVKVAGNASRGHRLENIKVLDLVEFEAGTGGGEKVDPKLVEEAKKAQAAALKEEKSAPKPKDIPEEDLGEDEPW